MQLGEEKMNKRYQIKAIRINTTIQRIIVAFCVDNVIDKRFQTKKDCASYIKDHLLWYNHEINHMNSHISNKDEN